MTCLRPHSVVKKKVWKFSGGPVVFDCTFTAMGPGSLLVGELRSHKPRGAAKSTHI